ncbi:hypothetical protein MVEN_02482500 [Mycena venus]|uniref:Uncharacterized protein n=1 Tax=Mycena venus TaxID=2733690 RepID=A0A8H6WXF1_9AGAR|nr:hypothetical protein MVEN_02482500 [Mycena venus]
MANKRVVKTLYTAKFYESPSSSESTHPPSSKPQQPSAYLEKLFHAHVALNQMEEVPSSRPNSPDQAHTDRVEALRQKVVDAYNATNGNPASGKWGLLANLLRTGSAKGKYRYVNTRTDAVPPQPGPEGWLLAENEEEWLAWENARKLEQPLLNKKRKEEQLLKEKVETWKRDIADVDDVMPDASPTLEVPEPSLPSKSKKSAPASDEIKSPSKTATTTPRAHRILAFAA